MKKYKYFSILAVILVFVLFMCKILFKTHSYNVLKVVSPFEIIVDKNNDGIIDENETILIDNDYQFFSKNNDSESLALALNINDYTKYAFIYLTEKFFSEVLLDKTVDIKSDNGKDVLYLSGEKYENILAKSGYIFKNGTPVNISAYNKRLNQIKKSNYKLYNVKSNKYHELTCKYGRKSHNYVLLAKYQLPKGAKKCLYCHPEKFFKQNISKTNIKRPPLVYNSDSIKLILTDYTNNLIPNRNGNSQISKELVKQINNAKKSIDIAIYGYDRVPVIEKALKQAIARGVKVRLVHDIDYEGKNIYANTFEFSNLIKNVASDKAYWGLKNPISYSNSIMHDKFYIFDKKVVLTGSANLSHTDLSDFNCNSVLCIRSERIANIYTQEFEQMYNNKFHNLKSKINEKEGIKLDNSLISVYFSPKDYILKNAIIPLINSSDKYIYMPVFVITDTETTEALINARKRGVDVKVIVDATNAKSSHSQHHILRKNLVPVKTENYAGKMHSKSIIIDDQYVVIGSMNFSKSGQFKNDENVIILKDSKIAKFYKRFFLYLWSKINNYWLNNDVSAESIYSIGSCSDGIDNDYDGKIDSNDEGCRAKIKSLR